MGQNANEDKINDLVNKRNSTIQTPNHVQRQCLVNTRNSTMQLPNHILRHCLSFLGSSDNYYFLASVSKDFKCAVEHLYGENRNTSAERIIATESTCRHIINLICQDLLFRDMRLIKGGISKMINKIVAAVFEHDRADIFEGSFKPFAYIFRVQMKVRDCLNF